MKIRTAWLIALCLAILAPISTTAFMATVLPDRVTIGVEFLPRRMDLPNTVIVPAGDTVELPADSTVDYVEVAGTLRASRATDTVLRVTTFVILPGGTVDFGTQADPIPCDRSLTIILRNVPIDTAKDPFQWGNGLVNFGSQTRVGCQKTPFAESVGSLASGATTITLTEAPLEWRVGDELLLPDTVQPVRGVTDPAAGPKPRRERPVTIAAMDGATLTLSKPLDFAHPSLTNPQGEIILRPRVANLTRNIVIRSENPAGTPGHTANIGHEASWDIRWNEFDQVGRTCNSPLDDTNLATGHIGTCQRGKYADHDHHAESAPGSAHVGNVYRGGLAKWALALHATSDVLVADNVGIDAPGAIFVTEDGNEVRNTFRHNFAAYSFGRPVFMDAAGSIRANCPGCEGAGFWFRGVMNVIDRNEAWNNMAMGINLMNQQQPAGILYPSVPGGVPNTSLRGTEVPISAADNVTAVNVVRGFEAWAVLPMWVTRLTSAFNVLQQVRYDTSDHIHLRLQDATIVCTPGRQSAGVHSDHSYVISFEMTGGSIRGCANGIEFGGGQQGIKISNLTLQNETNIAAWDNTTDYEQVNVIHQPLLNYPHRYIDFTPVIPVWDGISPLPTGRIGDMWKNQHGSQLIVRNWQGTGEDYRLFYTHSLGTNPAWYSAPDAHSSNVPVKGLTMQQAWDQYGMAYGGDVLKPSEAVQLDGVVNGLARKGLAVALGPPRAVLTFPTLREPAVPDPTFGVIRLIMVATGDPRLASDRLMVQIDNGRPFEASADDKRLDRRPTNTSPNGAAAAAPGKHTVKLWRTQKDQPTVLLPGSESIWYYCVGTCDDAPPPDDLCPNIDGAQTEIPEGLVIINGQCVPPPPVDTTPPAVTVTCLASGLVCTATATDETKLKTISVTATDDAGQQTTQHTTVP